MRPGDPGTQRTGKVVRGGERCPKERRIRRFCSAVMPETPTTARNRTRAVFTSGVVAGTRVGCAPGAGGRIMPRAPGPCHTRNLPCAAGPGRGNFFELHPPPHRMNASGTAEPLLIRHATPADAEAVARVFSGPRAVWGTLQAPYPTPEKWRRRIEEGPAAGIISLVACAGGEPVGMLGLHTHPDQPRIRHSAYLGMAVRDDWQGRGVGRALVAAVVDLADKWLNLERLELHVYVDNEPAIGLYRRFGFVEEGTLRRAAFREGGLQDVYVMGRLRPGRG